jgi:hypothetical protein
VEPLNAGPQWTKQIGATVTGSMEENVARLEASIQELAGKLRESEVRLDNHARVVNDTIVALAVLGNVVHRVSTYVALELGGDVLENQNRHMRMIGEALRETYTSMGRLQETLEAVRDK